MAIALLLSQAMAFSPSVGNAAPVDGVVADAAASRGSAIYQYYCAICHGVNADGAGRAAKLYDPRPANLKQSRVNDAYREMIIRFGGAQLGRSESMPAWSRELSVAQTADVIVYIKSIVTTQ